MNKYTDNKLVVMKETAELGLQCCWKAAQLERSPDGRNSIAQAFESQKQLLVDIYAELDARGVDYLKLYPDCRDWTTDDNLEERLDGRKTSLS